MAGQLEIEQITFFEYIKASWDVAVLGPLVYQNLKNPNTGPGQVYSSVMIVPNEAARTRNSIGTTGLFRSRGFLFFTVYAPEGSGSLIQKRVQDAIIEMFDEKVLPMSNGRKIVCEVCEPQTLGARDGTFRVAVSVPYHRDEWK